MKVGIIIQARLNSRRFPRKVLADLCGKPVLQHVIERCQQAEVAPVCVAAGVTHDVFKISQLTGSLACDWCLGHPDNVLRRLVDCARSRGFDYVVRVNGDSPLIDPRHIKELASMAGKYDYVGYSYDGKPSVRTSHSARPELVSFRALVRMMQAAKNASEHVTWLCHSSEPMSTHWIEATPDNFKTTIDTEDDLERIQAWMKCSSAVVA